MPRFLERDEAEREPPCEPIRGTASATSGRSRVSRRPSSKACTEPARLRCCTFRILRHGVPYRSLDVVRVPHHRTREPFVEDQPGQSRPDPARLCGRTRRQRARAALARDAVDAAARHVRARRRTSSCDDTLPLGDAAQTPDDYVRQLSATTGMPHVLVRRNMQKIAGVLTRDARPCCAA